MWKQIACASAAIAATFLLLPRAGANKNFVPDWTFQGSSLGAARTLGNAELARGKRRDRGYAQDRRGRLADSRQAASGRAVRIHIPLHRRLPRGRDAARAVDTGRNSRRLRRVAGGRKSRGRICIETRSAGPRNPTRTAQSGGSARSGSSRHRRKADEAARRPRRRQGRRDEAGGRTRLRAGRHCLRTRPTPVLLTPTGRTSGTRSRSSSTPTIFACGSTMDRRAEAPTARPTRISRSTAPWRCTSEARAKSGSNKWNSKIWAGAFCRTKRYPAASASSASAISTTPGPRRRRISITTASWISSPVHSIISDPITRSRAKSIPARPRPWARNTRRRRSTSPTTTPAMAGRTFWSPAGRAMVAVRQPEGRVAPLG